MSKKMKKVAFDSPCYESYEDVRARAKHHSLVQDYVELQKETEAARNNLMVLKQKQRTLKAEVRFLRRRHKFLLENRSSTLHEQNYVKPQPTQIRKSKKEKVYLEKQKTLHNLPPSGKRKAPQSLPSPEFDLILENSLRGVKQQSVQRVIANQRVRINGPRVSPFHDSNQKVDFCGRQEREGQPRKPVIDLNQIFREEEELLEQCEPFDPPMQSLIRHGIDEQQKDVQLSIYRNLASGSGSSGRPGKRKISWQDPVALGV